MGTAAIYVDSRAAALKESGDILIPMAEGRIGKEAIRGEIGEGDGDRAGGGFAEPAIDGEAEVVGVGAVGAAKFFREGVAVAEGEGGVGGVGDGDGAGARGGREVDARATGAKRAGANGDPVEAVFRDIERDDRLLRGDRSGRPG